MTLAQAKSQLSLEQFLQLPETKPVQEYVEGQIYTKPMPKGKHSAIQTFLAAAINQMGIPQKKARAFTELRCTFSGRSLVPDLSVFTWQRIPIDDQGEIEDIFSLPPDWAIEILSPDQSSTRVISNILFCLDQGTSLGWLIDPRERIVMSFLPQQQPQSHQGEEPLPVLSDLADLRFSPTTVFSYLSLS